MASALQCPACGHKHRLSELTGDPIFSCEQCGRLLKTPMEYRRPDASGPVDMPRPNGKSSAPGGGAKRGAAPKRDSGSVPRTAGAPAAAAAASSGSTAVKAPRARSRRSPATLTIPLQIIGWVFALLIGGVIIRYLAKFTGVLTGDSIIDLITGSGIGRYVRLFAVVPFWALASAGLMTLFIEGARRWQDRQVSPSVRPAKKQRLTVPPANKPRPAGEATGPKPVTRAPAPRDAAPREPAPAPRSSSAENRMPAGAAAAPPRQRRIPKRDISDLS